MPTTSVDGLVSGLNTSDIITKLMTLERQPQDALKTQLASLQARIKAYQSINTKVGSLNDAASDLAGPTGWKVFAATSSAPTAVTASAASTAGVGSLSFTVDQMAAA